MEVMFQSVNVSIDQQRRDAIQQTLTTVLEHVAGNIDLVNIRLGESAQGEKARIRHCRATAVLRGSGKAVWVDRSHQQLESAARGALFALATVIEKALARGTAEFAATPTPLREVPTVQIPGRGAGWSMLGPLIRH
jgi:hypothetical protein